MRKLAIYIGILLGCLCFCKAQQRTVNFCTTDVDSNGYVKLQWTFGVLPISSFHSYVLERKNPATGQYNVILTTQIRSNNQFIDSNANALNDSVKYRITATTSDLTGDNSYVDSTITILPSVFNVQNQSQYAYISWNKQYYPNGHYLVYRKMPNRNMTLIATTSQTHFQDTINSSICDDTIYYMISYLSAGYQATSPKSGAWFNDPLPTTPCTLDVVTVDTAIQNIVLSWQASPDPDIMGYFICQGSPCMALDTVWGQFNTTYTCTTRSSDSVNAFRIYAFDSCFSASALTDPYNNMVLNMQARHCTREINFSWNEYINMPGNVNQYTLYLKYDNAPFRAVATEPAGSFATQYTIPAGVRQVKAYIMASNPGNTKQALSNIRTFDMMTVDTAAFIYTLGVSVADDGYALELKFLTDTQFAATGYNIYRRAEVGQFQRIMQIPPSANPTIDIVDRDVDLSAHRYTYYISVWDECELIEKKSDRVPMIYARLQTDNGTNTISWSPYQGAGNFIGYNLLQKTESDPSWQPIASTQACNTTDNTTHYGRVWYRVEAEYINPSNGRHCTALSQIVEYHGEPTVWVPNAFTPKRDNNNRFLPKMNFVKDEEYTMRIYNRFGLLIFETTDPKQPWDGKYKGKTVPSGAYVFMIQYLGDDNYSNIVKGTITVIN